ncbi:hypothetical protein [Enterococcus devriesei]|uniref:hypothetical protein n=1 Tax=Enterococcus devriesei TaxID=319970 RepID=UPI0028AF25D5|nr:hypothetical protein [Enterococcus devriesei]
MFNYDSAMADPDSNVFTNVSQTNNSNAQSEYDKLTIAFIATLISLHNFNSVLTLTSLTEEFSLTFNDLVGTFIGTRKADWN